MRKRIFVSIVVVVLALVLAVPAGAITKNWVEDFEHPFVGLVVFYDENGEFSHRCSGSLLDSTTFLTAGHCTAGVDSARVYFQQDAGANFDPVTQIDPITGYPEFCAAGTLGVVCATSDELYDFDFANGGFPETHDVGLVILDQPIALAEYGQLPTAGVSMTWPLRADRMIRSSLSAAMASPYQLSRSRLARTSHSVHG